MVRGLCVLTLCLPLFVSAHAGIEKQAGNVAVYLKQFPLAPLVGEEVKFYFGFNDRTNHKQLANMAVNVRVIDTFTGDESRDVVISEKNFTTDANGDFDFTHTFTKENYFDVEVSMIDPSTDAPVETGVLVQVRGAGTATGTQNASQGSQPLSSLLYVAVGLIIGGLAVRRFRF
ncbi:MAG: hypothetical protein RLZZ67_332 [Candidatus Parcubacteria bacterium]